MRHQIALNLGAKIGADFTPQSRFIELVMNRKHLGKLFIKSCRIKALSQ